MDSSKNGKRTSSFKKFSRIRIEDWKSLVCQLDLKLKNLQTPLKCFFFQRTFQGTVIAFMSCCYMVKWTLKFKWEINSHVLRTY
jgi:hypothetical protein